MVHKMTFLILLHKSRDKKQCNSNVSVRWRQRCVELLSSGGRAFRPFDPLLLLKKVTENAATISLTAWLAFDQLSCNFEDFGGVTPSHL